MVVLDGTCLCVGNCCCLDIGIVQTSSATHCGPGRLQKIEEEKQVFNLQSRFGSNRLEWTYSSSEDLCSAALVSVDDPISVETEPKGDQVTWYDLCSAARLSVDDQISVETEPKADQVTWYVVQGKTAPQNTEMLGRHVKENPVIYKQVPVRPVHFTDVHVAPQKWETHENHLEQKLIVEKPAATAYINRVQEALAKQEDHENCFEEKLIINKEVPAATAHVNEIQVSHLIDCSMCLKGAVSMAFHGLPYPNNAHEYAITHDQKN